jgi:acetyltransferase-like isoleucine patch superfamily enzyme/glycosyltransferase involved in cell wall biosynthesis
MPRPHQIPARQSPHSVANRAARVLWAIAWTLLFRPSPRVAHRWRNVLLRVFGAALHPTARVYPRARCWAPWNLRMDAYATIADDVEIYCADRIHVGEHTTVSQYAFLCTATHDYEDPDFPLVTAPITIGPRCWIAADVFVGPGVTIGPGTVVGVRSVVLGDLPAWVVAAGTPATARGPRRLEGHGPERPFRRRKAEEAAAILNAAPDRVDIEVRRSAPGDENARGRSHAARPDRQSEHPVAPGLLDQSPGPLGTIMTQTIAKPMPPPGPSAGTVPVSVVILTLNEQVNIADCLASCEWSDDVHVLDSGSTDRTREIAEELGAKVYTHPFESFGEQRNWAIENIECRHDWIFHLDADERFTPELVEAMGKLLASNPLDAGFHIPQKLMFMGRWLKRSAVYPTYQMRLFHKTRMRFCDYGHGQRELTDGDVGILNVPYLHYGFAKGLYDWLDKHNRYSSLEALQVLDPSRASWRLTDVFSRDRVVRRRAWKELGYELPFRPTLRWFVTLFVYGGILEGRAGWTYARLLAMYEQMTSLKLRLLRSRYRAITNFEKDTVRVAKPDVFDANDREGRQPDSVVQPAKADEVTQTQPEPSPWTFKEKVGRAVWMLIGKPIFRLSFHNWYRFRRVLLRAFGAQIGQGVAIRPSANIEVPWMLRIDDDATIGDYAILYSLGPIFIGRRAIISQYAHLCAGTHDYADHTFRLIRTPVTIGDDVWIGADAFVGPGVTIGALSVLGARSSAYKDLKRKQVFVGNPARPIKERVIK